MDKIERQRAANLWEPFARKFPPIAKSCRLAAEPAISLDQIGGLAAAKDEIKTYACAVTDPEIYKRWGTVQPSGLLLIGPPGSGKSMLAEALASLTDTPFLSIGVQRLVFQVLHAGAQAGALLSAFGEALSELPRLTVYFDELDFLQSLSEQRRELPAAPIVDFLLELLDETISIESTQVVGSSGHPDSLSPMFLHPGRFERVVGVHPSFPDDVIAAVKLHAASAERSAGRMLFDNPDWKRVIEEKREASIGNWVRLLHGVLRRKARCDASGEEIGPVTTANLLEEVARSKNVRDELPVSTGRYL